MTRRPQYPFSDLTAEEVRSMILVAHRVRSLTIRAMFASLFGRRRQTSRWAEPTAPVLRASSCG